MVEFTRKPTYAVFAVLFAVAVASLFAIGFETTVTAALAVGFLVYGLVVLQLGVKRGQRVENS